MSDQFLKDVGLLGKLSQKSINALREQCNDRLDCNVEARLKATLTESDYEIYSAYLRSDDFAGGFEYLDTKPVYALLLEAETHRIEGEVRAAVPAILAIEECLGHLRDEYEQDFRRFDGCGSDEMPLD